MLGETPSPESSGARTALPDHLWQSGILGWPGAFTSISALLTLNEPLVYLSVEPLTLTFRARTGWNHRYLTNTY